VDDPIRLEALLEALVRISRELCIIFPLHPRTAAALAKADLDQLMRQGRIVVTSPLSYLRSLGFIREARLVITDSGGVQEETTALGVPCLTVRDNTERPITVEKGTNTLVGSSPEALVRAVQEIVASGGKKGCIPALWDGKAALRIADHLRTFLAI
jgi:UDP-N-acetylglucosamine 2-epimerase (non-hydrolysing)